MVVMTPLIGPLISESHFGVKLILSVCKRLKTKVSTRVINVYKRLIRDVVIGNQGLMKFVGVAPIRELRV